MVDLAFACRGRGCECKCLSALAFRVYLEFTVLSSFICVKALCSSPDNWAFSIVYLTALASSQCSHLTVVYRYSFTPEKRHPNAITSLGWEALIETHSLWVSFLQPTFQFKISDNFEKRLLLFFVQVCFCHYFYGVQFYEKYLSN